MFSKRNILIVDDDQAIVQAAMRALMAKRHDLYEPIIAMDGYEAIITLKERLVDCIVLDLQMTNCNGLEVLDRIKKDRALKDIHVIISSGFLDESMEEELRSFGVMHILRKPYTSAELIEAIDEVMLHHSRSH